MPEIREMYLRQRKFLFLLLSIYVLGWGFTPYQAVFMGLILGTSFSLLNLWMLVRRSAKFEQATLQGKKVRSLGSFSRMATAAIAVIIALRYPEDIHIVSVVFGLMTSYIVIMIDFFLHSFHKSK